MRELDDWRRDLERHGFARELLDELADHLCCDIERRVAAGADPAAAAQAAQRAIGTPSSLSREYRKVHAMPKPARLLAMLASLAFVAAAAAPTHSVLALLDAPSLAFVSAFVLAGLCASFGPRQTLRSLRDVLFARDGVGLSNSERDAHSAVLGRGYRLAWVSGGLGALAGIIRTLMNLSDPAELGAAAGLGLLSLLYGALLAEVVFANATQWLAAPVVRPAD